MASNKISQSALNLLRKYTTMRAPLKFNQRKNYIFVRVYTQRNPEINFYSFFIRQCVCVWVWVFIQHLLSLQTNRAATNKQKYIFFTFLFLFCFYQFFKHRMRNNVLCANESINFKNTNFKIAGRTQRRIVERLATVRFTKSHIFVHPYGLTIAI